MWTLNFHEFHPFPGLSAGSVTSYESKAPLPAKFAKAWLSPCSNCLGPPKHNRVQKTQKIVTWKKKKWHPAQTTLPLLLSTTEFHYFCCSLADFLAQHSEHWNRLFCTASAITEGLYSLQNCRQFIAHIPPLDSPSLSFIQTAFAARLLWCSLYKLWPLTLSPNSDTLDPMSLY